MKRTSLILELFLFVAMVLCACENQNGADDIRIEPEIGDSEEELTVSATHEAEQQTPEQGAKETLGFSGGNIGQGGLMCGDVDGYIYYRSEMDSWYLYKAKADGSEKQKLCDDIPTNINVLDGWVYYSNFNDGFSIYRIRTDGTERKRLIEGYCNNIYVARDVVYFDMRNDSNIADIYRMNTDGANLKMLLEGYKVGYYFDGNLFCCRTDGLSRYDLETGELITLIPKYTHYIYADETGAHFWSVDENSFDSIDLNGTNEESLIHGGDFYNYSDDCIYYVKNGGNYDVFCCETTTGEEIQLSSFLERPFDINGDIIDDLDSLTDDDWAVHEGISSVYVVGGEVFARGSLRKALIEYGHADCLMRFTGKGNIEVWD